MITTQLALAKELLDIFVAGDVYDDPAGVEDSILSLLGSLDIDEAEALPRAYEDALRSLESDLLRWRVAGDLAVRVDLFEVADSLAAAVSRIHDAHQAANLAALAVHPSLDPHGPAVTVLESLQLHESLVTLLGVRLGRDEAHDDIGRILDIQMWPGRYGVNDLRQVAPCIYVAEHGAPPDLSWRAVAALARAGARVRRIPEHVRDASTPWASPDLPLVSWSGTAVVAWRKMTATHRGAVISAPTDLDGALPLVRFVGAVNRALPAGMALRRRQMDLSPATQAFSPSSLTAGAFDVSEMSFLGAASRGVVQRLSHAGLHPVEADVYRWRFSQLVTVRILQAFKARGARYQRDLPSIVTALSDIAEASQTHRVGVDVNGGIYVDDGEGFRTLRGGQQALDSVLAIDDAFRPFELGGGIVPDLLRPGRTTTVHPLTAGGTPCVESRRVSARAIALVAANRGHDVLRSAYPELSPPELTDAVAVGNAILAAS
jgi:uncharacterized protein (DUF433 family)